MATVRGGVLALFGLLVGLAAGVAIGIAMGDGGQSAGGGSARRGGEAGGEGSADESARPGEAPAAARPRAGGGSLKLPDVPLGKIPAGDGVVTGSVRDLEGRPVPGVRVTLTPESDPEADPAAEAPDDRPPEPDLDSEIRAVLRQHRWSAAARRVGVSDDVGAFRVEGLPEGRSLSVQLWARDHDVAVSGNTWSVRAGETLELVATPVLRVAFAVTGPDGRPPVSASVSASSDSSSLELAWSPGRRPARLTRGVWRFRAVSGEMQELASPEITTDLSRADAPTTVELRIAPRPGVVGKVTFAGPGRPLRAVVRARPLGAGATAPKDRFLRETGPQSEIEEGGRYSLLDLAPGRWCVGVVTSGGEVLASAETEVLAAATTPLDLRAEGGEDSGAVLVRIETSDGRPPVGVNFSAGMEWEGNSYSSGTTWRPAGPGVWRVALADSDPAWFGSSPPGTELKWSLWVQSGSHGTARIDAVPGAAREPVTVKLEPAATLDVTVTGLDPAQPLGLSVSVHPDGDADWGWADADVDASGKARLRSVRPGNCILTLTATVDEWQQRQVATKRIVCVGGENTAEIAMAPLWDVAVKPDVENSVDFVLCRQTDGGGWDWYGEPRFVDGAFVYSKLGAGTYRLRREPGGDREGGEMLFALPGPTSIRFVPRPFRAFRLSPDEGDPAHLAGFRYGDLVVAIDGKEFANWAEAEAALALAGTRPTVRFTVLRGGARIEIDHDPRKLGEREPSSL